jgi:hypothetical protein
MRFVSQEAANTTLASKCHDMVRFYPRSPRSNHGHHGHKNCAAVIGRWYAAWSCRRADRPLPARMCLCFSEVANNHSKCHDMVRRHTTTVTTVTTVTKSPGARSETGRWYARVAVLAVAQTGPARPECVCVTLLIVVAISRSCPCILWCYDCHCGGMLL